MKRIIFSLQQLLPENKVGIVEKERNCTDISVYSKHLEPLLGWYAKRGSKFVQNVSVPTWIKSDKEYIINCLRGLFETDGSVYFDRGYKMAIFSTIIKKLAEDVDNLIFSLGFTPHFYEIMRATDVKKLKVTPKYQVRLSKNVTEFLDLVNIDKS